MNFLKIAKKMKDRNIPIEEIINLTEFQNNITDTKRKIKTNSIQKIKKNQGTSLSIEGVLLTKLDNRSLVGYKIAEKVKEMFPTKTFKTIINRSSHIEEAPIYGQTVIKYAFNSKGSKDYRELAKEIIEKEGECNA